MGSTENRAIIEPGATIGEGTTIGDFCFIGKDVVIGTNNTIGSHVVIDGHTTLGHHNTIENHTVLGTPPQDIHADITEVSLHIGDHNHIGSKVFITAGTDHGGFVTRVGNHNQLMQGVHLGHDVQMGNHCFMGEHAALGGHVLVQNHAHLGRDAAVHQFVLIGAHASLEIGAVLTQDLPPYCVAEGNRAKITKVNHPALENAFTGAEISEISEAFHALFDAGSPKTHALEALEKEPSVITEKLYRFIVDSKRGIPFKRNTHVD